MRASSLFTLVVAVLVLGACGGASDSLSVETFAADTTQVALGQPVHLTWSVQNASGLELSPAGSVDPGLHGTTVYPGQTTTYVLKASGAKGASAESQPITVTVGAGLDCRVQQYSTLSFSGAVISARVNSAQGQRAAVSTPIQVSLGGSDVTRTLSCGANASGCVAVYADLPPPGPGVTYTATARVEGQTFTTACVGRAPGALQNLQLPRVTATRADASSVSVAWAPVPSAKSYQVSVLDLDVPGPPQNLTVTTGISTTLAVGAAHNLAVQVEAADFDWAAPALPDLPDATALSRSEAFLSADAAFTLYTPASYAQNTLTVTLPALAADEHVAIIPINLSASDNVTATVAITNVQTPPSASLGVASSAGPVAAELASLRSDPAFHAQLRAKERGLAALLKLHPGAQKLRAPERATNPPGNTTFCVLSALSGTGTRRNAVLMATTAHAAFYVDQADLADYTPYESPAVSADASIWKQLGDVWENTIYPTDTGTFGPESDVDGNGRLVILLSKQLGAAQNGAIVLGYFDAQDVVAAKDTSASCTDTVSNDADLFYLNGIANVLPASPSQTQVNEVIQGTYPDTLAHEFQHLINFNEHHLVHDPGGSTGYEDTWINEGLSVTAEDLSGFGWNRAAGRQDAALYLNRADDAFLRYSEASLTYWQADPIGNYQGAHSFFRLLADQQPSVLGSLVRTASVGIGNLERVLGVPFAWSFASWTSGLLLSNEGLVPDTRFNYAGAAWTPLHQKIASFDGSGVLTRQGYLRYVPLGTTPATATLRTRGYNVFVTGAAAAPGQPAVLTITATTPPHVAVIRFTGTLPEGNPIPH